MSGHLIISNLTKRFVAVGEAVVESISLEVTDGEIFALLGPSGCGKTTTLRMIAGFERADSGSVTLGGRTLTDDTRFVMPEKRGIGFVFQDFALFPHLNVGENVRFGLWERSRAQQVARGNEMLELVGLADLSERRPHELSGGQQQRVALARALAPEPRLILLDEPLSNVDAAARSELREEIRIMLRTAGTTAVIVSHDQEEVLSLADRVAVMNEGRVIQVGTPEDLYRHPADSFVASFVGRTNLFELVVQGSEANLPFGRVSLDRAAEGVVVLAIRPEHLEISAPLPSRPLGLVKARLFKGHDITFTVQIEGRDILVHTDNRCPFKPGDQVSVVALESAVIVSA